MNLLNASIPKSGKADCTDLPIRARRLVKIFDYYANSNMKLVKRNQKLYNPDLPLLIGEVNDGDVVKRLMNPAILICKLDYSKIFCYGYA